MCEYGFIEMRTLLNLSKTSDGGRPSVDHQLTIDMAKELCMIQRTDIGRRIPTVFHSCGKGTTSVLADAARADGVGDAAKITCRTVLRNLERKS